MRCFLPSAFFQSILYFNCLAYYLEPDRGLCGFCFGAILDRLTNHHHIKPGTTSYTTAPPHTRTTVGANPTPPEWAKSS